MRAQALHGAVLLAALNAEQVLAQATGSAGFILSVAHLPRNNHGNNSERFDWRKVGQKAAGWAGKIAAVPGGA
jgi:hypothetical protein